MRRSAKPTVQGIKAAELPSPDMTAVVTEETFGLNQSCDRLSDVGRAQSNP
jgi:hypothetical protein